MYYKEIIWLLAKNDFKLRYNGSFLGFFWALLKPLLIFLILNFVFSNIFGANIEYYSLKLLLGIILWNFFAEGTTTALISQLSKSHIISKIYIPKWIILLASTINILLTFLINLFILAVFFAIQGVMPSLWAILMFVFYSIEIYIFILGFGLLTSVLYLKLRDLNQIWEVILTGGFYVCPIIFPISAIPSQYHWILFLNPMTFPVLNAKNVLFENAVLYSFGYHVMYFLVLMVFLLLSYLYFHKYSKYTVEYL